MRQVWTSQKRAQLLLALASVALGCGMILPGCSSSSVSTDPGGAARSGSSGGGADTLPPGGHAGAGASAGSELTCLGSAPACRGIDLHKCCGQDPYATAICKNGQWMCFLFDTVGVTAPGCNDQLCEREVVGAAGSDGAGEAGDASAGQAGEGGAGQATGGGGAGQAGGGGASTNCGGNPPNCFGADLHTCCGQDPAGPAACQNGAWMCFGSPAPGCNGQRCI